MIVARVRRTILERKLWSGPCRVLVACSGGPDSAALLCALAELADELHLSLLAASVDHGLRSDAARDVAIASAQATALGVPFHALRVDVAAGASRQAAARHARYAALQACAAANAATRLAVGHTQDDQAETVLMRVLRGTGTAGLGAIEPLRADGVVRPLIDCARADVHAFVGRTGLPIATDPSNADPAYTRARVRSELLPALQREDPQIVVHLAALADDARSTHEALLSNARAMVEAAVAMPREADGMFDLSAWRDQPSALVRLALRGLLEPQLDAELSRAHLEQLERALALGGEVWLPGQRVARSAGDGRVSVTISAPRRNQ